MPNERHLRKFVKNNSDSGSKKKSKSDINSSNTRQEEVRKRYNLRDREKVKIFKGGYDELEKELEERNRSEDDSSNAADEECGSEDEECASEGEESDDTFEVDDDLTSTELFTEEDTSELQALDYDDLVELHKNLKNRLEKVENELSNRPQ
jgi:hypothetical protein